ncbi:MAG TPA: radical SAM protein [Pyrinomonadaceae bacterium]|jgi:anaerobic magnesium-protoporphyrin IX monomethyl ester cyclase
MSTTTAFPKITASAVQAGQLAHVARDTAPDNPAPGTELLRAALLNPQDSSSADGFRVMPPLGLGYLASVARAHGFHVDIFDFAAAERLDEESLIRCGLLEYEVYGISSYTETFTDAVKLARLLRRRRPDALIVLGGYHASSAAEHVLADVPEIDVLVRREGEEAFTRILQARFAGAPLADIPGTVTRSAAGEIVEGAPASGLLSLDELPLPALDVKFGPEKYYHFTHAGRHEIKETLGIVSSRGCPKRCTFCSIVVLSPKWRARSVESLMNEVRYRYERKPFRHITFQDANFFVYPPRTLEFARRLYAFDPDITWSGTATADTIVQHAGILSEIARLNCAYLEVGIESGNARSLARFNKRTTVDDNCQALRLLREAGIDIGLDFIMFEPEMMFEDLVENVEFLYRNELFGYWPADHLFSDLRLYPDTPVRAAYEMRLGQPFAPHSLPSVPYADEVIQAAAACMHYYQEKAQTVTDQLFKSLSASVNQLLFTDRQALEKNPALVHLCQRAQETIVKLRHLPYTFLCDLLGRAEALRAGRSPQQMIERIDWPEERKIWEEAFGVLGLLSRPPAEAGERERPS